MGISRGRPSRSAPYFKIWPRRWNGAKTFLRIIDLDTATDANWFQTHYVEAAGGTMVCLGDECPYCPRQIRQETRLYAPALLYVAQEGKHLPGPLVLLELYPSAGAELERIYRPGLLIVAERKHGRGMTLEPHPQQTGMPPCPRPFDILAAMQRLGMVPASAVDADQEEQPSLFDRPSPARSRPAATVDHDDTADGQG